MDTFSISDIKFEEKVILEGQEHEFQGQTKVKIGGGYSQQWQFFNLKTKRYKFFPIRAQLTFVWNQTGQRIKILNSVKY